MADINNIYLGDLLKDNDMITNDDNGVYRISFSSFGDDPTKYESIAIDGIEIPAIKDLSPKLEPVSFEMAQLPESLVLDDIKESFSIDFPTLGQAVKVDPISIRQELSLNLPSELSGGMKQRVSLARAFLRRTPILLLDEPTKELDSQNATLVLEEIKKQGQERLVILVSHNLDDVDALSAVKIPIK